jgi:hypothetical protein
MFIRYRGIERQRTVVHRSFTTNEGVVMGHPRSLGLEASLLRLLVGVFGVDNTLLENLADPLAQGAISLEY